MKDHDTTDDTYQVRQYRCYKQIGVILCQLQLIGCDVLNVHLGQVRYYTSLKMQSVIF
jgi:hypothetical protein